MLKTLDVVAAIIERDDKILLAQRPAHADQPGMWEFAGGKVEAGETQPEALIRELREELGIDARPAQYVASHQRVGFSTAPKWFFCITAIGLRLAGRDSIGATQAVVSFT